jgi:hypothetical protein
MSVQANAGAGNNISIHYLPAYAIAGAGTSIKCE